MNYNKKQMQPLIDKYAINPETNKLFISICEMFDNQPNYQLWGVKMIFSKVITFDQLVAIHDWATKNQTMIKMLAKQNIVSYSNKAAIGQLFKEMEGLDRLSIVKDAISHYNTEQRKMLTDALLGKEMKAMDAYNNANIKKWVEIFRKFNRLPLDRKNKFYSNCSRLKQLNDLMSAIKTALEETYNWEKEDFLAFLANNAPDCEVVYEQGNFVLVKIASFKSSKLLCGSGRTTWCITQQDSYWRQYVGDHTNRDQYFLFDFNRNETDSFAHIGFTMEDGRHVYCAQTCCNHDMKNGFTQGNEKMNLNQALEKAGIKMSIFLRLKPLNNYKWDMESILTLLKGRINDFAIAYEKDGRIIITPLSQSGSKLLCEHTLITTNIYNVDDKHKTYIFIDTNLKVNDEKSLIAMRYEGDQYGSMSLMAAYDAYNTNIKENISNYLNTLGISRSDYMGKEDIDPRILLHKYINENAEAEAIELIKSSGKDFDVNYKFNERIPIIQAINSKMFGLFEEIINHPKFDSTVSDGFGESLLESLIYLYGCDEITSSAEEKKCLEKMIKAILKCNTFEFNTKDLNNDTALSIACEYPSMVWVVKALVAKKQVNPNVANDFEHTAVGSCIKSKNLEALKVLGQRPDLKPNDIDKKLAKNCGVNLADYIKPNPNIFEETEVSSAYDYELEKALAEVC